MNDRPANVAGLPSQRGITMNTTTCQKTRGCMRTDRHKSKCAVSDRSRRLEDTYSLGVLWNIDDAAALNADVASGRLDPVPVSGDAHLASRAALLEATDAMNKAWADARAEHHATDRDADRRRDEAREAYREAVTAGRTAE